MIRQLEEILNLGINDIEDLLTHFRQVLPYRTRGYHQDEIGPIIPENNSKRANEFTERIFTLGNYTMEMKDKINWYATPTGDLEWNGGFVRQGHFVVMANEYQKTGDEKYAKAVIDQMIDYIDNIPVFNPDGKPYLTYKKSTWRPFEAAARVGETWQKHLVKLLILSL